MARNNFFVEDTVLDGVWSEYNFGSSMQAIFIVNRGTDPIEFSFNGLDVDGKLLSTDGSESRDNIDEETIYVRGVGASVDIQIEAWRGSR